MNGDAARRNAIDLYRRLRLPDPEHIGERYPHQVSGGQLQRAMTAMAMSCRPDLIVFDEPTSSLTRRDIARTRPIDRLDLWMVGLETTEPLVHLARHDAQPGRVVQPAHGVGCLSCTEPARGR